MGNIITKVLPYTAIQPSLSVRFTNANLDSRVTISRALNTATVVDSSGSIVSVAADLPRFDYNPLTLACNGLLVEETRTNLLEYSEDFTGASWTSNGTTSQTATTVTDNDASLAANRYQQFTIANDGASYVASWYVAKNQTNIVALQFQVFNGTAINYGIALNTTTGAFNQASTIASDPGANCTVTDAGANGWRIAIRLTNNSSGNTAARVRFFPAYATALGSGSTAANTSLTGTGTCTKMQLEIGAFVTSYIPTDGTAGGITRNADVATITGTNFSSWWQATRGGVLVRYRPSTVSGTRPVLQFDDTTADNIIALRGNTTNPELYIKATTDQAQIDAGTIAANTSYRFAGTWDTNNCAATLNSGVAVTDLAATIPAVTQARLGSDGTNYLNGHLEAIEYWDQRLSNATLQSYSTSAGYQSLISPVIQDNIIS